MPVGTGLGLHEEALKGSDRDGRVGVLGAASGVKSSKGKGEKQLKWEWREKKRMVLSLIMFPLGFAGIIHVWIWVPASQVS